MSVAWFDSVTLTVEVAFADGPLAASPTWTDITAYVRAPIRTSRGKQSEGDAFPPGSMSLTLDNRDRRFDPDHAAGPYFGNLLPMRRIRFRAAHGASPASPVFDGYVLGWPQAYTNPSDATATVTVVDAFRLLENARLRRWAYEGVVAATATPLGYWPLQELTDDGRLENAVDVTRPLYDPGYPGTRLAPVFDDVGGVVGAPKSMIAANDPADGTSFGWYAENGALPSDPKGLVAWLYDAPTGYTWPRLSVRAGSTTVDGFEVTVEPVGGLLRVDVDYCNAADNRTTSGTTSTVFVHGVNNGPNMLAVTASATTLTVWWNAVQVLSVTLNAATIGGPGIAAVTLGGATGQSTTRGVSHLSVHAGTLTADDVSRLYLAGITGYGDPNSDRTGERVGRVLDEIGWPSGRRDVSTGDTHLGPYTAAGASPLAYLRPVELAEQGLLFVGADGSIVFRDRQWQWTTAATGTPPTFVDDGSDLSYLEVVIDSNSVDPIRNIADVTWSAGQVQVVDTASRDAYGWATEPVSVPSIDRADIARELGEYVVRTRKDPATRITALRINCRTDPSTTFPAIFALEIGDRVVVERRPQGVGSAIVKTLVVQGIEHDVGLDTWFVTLYLSPAPLAATEAPYLLVGDSTYGVIGSTAGNLVPY